MKVGAERREALREALEQVGRPSAARPRAAASCGATTLDGAHVTLWRTGTVRVSGKGEYLEVVQRLVEEFALPDTVAETQLPPTCRATPPWAGVDESGKGDYFGPLVSAAVVVTPHAAAELAAAGVQDSKRLTDTRVPSSRR